MMSHYLQMKTQPTSVVPARTADPVRPVHTTAQSKDLRAKAYDLARRLSPWCKPVPAPSFDKVGFEAASRMAAQALQTRTQAVASKAGVPAESIAAFVLDKSRAARSTPNVLGIETLDATTLRQHLFTFLTSKARKDQQLNIEVNGTDAITAGQALHDLGGALDKHLTRLNPTASRSVIDNGIRALLSRIEVTTDRAAALQIPNSGVRIVISVEGENGAIDRRAARVSHQRRNALLPGTARALSASFTPAGASGPIASDERVTWL